ncbi:DUF4184 family protein [Paenibacillus psychroresistens]|uniref:DUF4184 family protein n=1 Tax=Paenibacillus psychroresistens TaxID=1778678 RepID=UPI001391FD7B
MFSIIGLAVEFIVMIYMLKKVQPSGIRIRSASIKQKIRYWAIAFSVMIITVLLKLTLTSSNNYIGILVVAPISGMFMGILISSCLFNKNSYS